MYSSSQFSQNRVRMMVALGVMITAWLMNSLAPLAQEPEPGSRAILRIYSDFETKRQKKKVTAKRPARPQPPSVSELPAHNLIGITLWRVPGNSTQKIERAEAASQPLLKAERLSALSQLIPGDKIRLTIEVPREGYLYIVSREAYADGTVGTPYLVFPSKRINGGDNQVAPGQLTGIPSVSDNPPYFELQRSRPNQVAELISFVVLPAPVLNLMVEAEPIELTPQLFAAWKRWESAAQKMELPTRDSPFYTEAEQAAESKVVSRRLRQGDPLPQNLLLADSRSESVMVTIPLKFRGSK